MPVLEFRGGKAGAAAREWEAVSAVGMHRDLKKGTAIARLACSVTESNKITGGAGVGALALVRLGPLPGTICNSDATSIFRLLRKRWRRTFCVDGLSALEAIRACQGGLGKGNIPGMSVICAVDALQETFWG